MIPYNDWLLLEVQQIIMDYELTKKIAEELGFIVLDRGIKILLTRMTTLKREKKWDFGFTENLD